MIMLDLLSAFLGRCTCSRFSLIGALVLMVVVHQFAWDALLLHLHPVFSCALFYVVSFSLFSLFSFSVSFLFGCYFVMGCFQYLG